LVLIVSIVAEGEKTNKSSSLPGVNKIEEKIEKEVLNSPKHLIYFQTKIKFVKGPPPKRDECAKTLNPKHFSRPKHKKPFGREGEGKKIQKRGGINLLI